MFPRKLLAVFFLVVILLIAGFSKANADELDDINKQISDLTSALNQSIAATKPLESQLKTLTSQIEGIKARVTGIEADLITKQKNIDKSYLAMEKQQDLFDKTVRDFYIKSYYNSPLLAFLSGQSASTITKFLAYQEAIANRDKAIITNIALSIADLEEKSQKLKSEQVRLIASKAALDEQSQKLDEVVKGAKAYQQDVSSKISELSQRQQEILNARSGGFTATIGDSDLADDYNASIKGFREAAPSGSFAAFSFGAFTHRKGMSQYGARGRATSGQDAKTILKAYYGKEPVSKDTGGSIKVSGFGEMDFEGKYLLGIAEMPSSWHPEALKAQAIAARTYAYRYKTEGREICTTEACQVYNDGKAANPPDAWRQAVESTRGQVVEDVVTYYASTHGGFASPIGWDTTDGQGGGNFIDKTYDKIGGSPWLVKAWYRKGYSSSGDSCGRDNPWLSSAEMSDIINAAMVLYNGGNTDETGRITPTTTSCWGGNPYSLDELRRVSDKYSGGISSVTGVSVSQGDGTTNEVVFQTDKGERRLSGGNFKTAFNLRAPGYMSIPQSGFAFFNIEKK
ncbi:MAG: SpoIID/LytB domain-containing protein [bacterium]|nr:SpoIID/LytB domain-containing protein [bacterium]